MCIGAYLTSVAVLAITNMLFYMWFDEYLIGFETILITNEINPMCNALYLTSFFQHELRMRYL